MELRNATVQDASFIAKVLMAGMHLYDFESEMDENQRKIYSRCLKVANRTDTIYSFRNAKIAEISGETAGALVSYPGDIYPEGILHTFSLMSEDMGKAARQWEDETGPGEYYLDSLAVRPKFRRKGVGRALIRNGIKKGRALGFNKVTLVADSAMPRLVSLYKSIGFNPVDRVKFQGIDFTKMAI